MSGDIGGKGYAPLPQSISNTDTEDEDDDHHQDELTDSISKGHSDGRLSDSTILCKNGRFYPLDETKNLTNVRNGRSSFAYSNDDIPIMMLDGQAHNDLWKRRDMSPLRRFCLVSSILLCIFTILIFLYVLPCDNSLICPSLSEPKSSVSWDKTLDGVELHGPISIIPGSPHSLIFLRRGQQFGKSYQITLPGGVLSMNSVNGIPLWLVPLKRLPINIDCETFDMNGSGKPDCLVSGKGGLLISIEPISGTIHWNSVVYTHPDLPLRLPDVDSDKIEDLLTVEQNADNGDSLNFVLISGKKGSLLARQPVDGCINIKLERIDSNFDVSYLCYSADGKKTSKIVSLKQQIESLSTSHVHRKFVDSQRTPAFPKRSLNETWDLTPYHRLYVQNQGDCPGENCQASVNLTLQNSATKETRLIWDHISPKSFVAQPAVLNNMCQNYTTGFALRFWHWTEPAKIETTDSGSTLLEQTLTERVLIVLMNYTNVRVLNASQSELIQFCLDADCQPDLERQANSISVVDLNDDGTPELISYRSTYSIEGKEKSLSSIVQVVKLNEIFKLQLR